MSVPAEYIVEKRSVTDLITQDHVKRILEDHDYVRFTTTNDQIEDDTMADHAICRSNDHQDLTLKQFHNETPHTMNEGKIPGAGIEASDLSSLLEQFLQYEQSVSQPISSLTPVTSPGHCETWNDKIMLFKQKSLPETTELTPPATPPFEEEMKQKFAKDASNDVREDKRIDRADPTTYQKKRKCEEVDVSMPNNVPLPKQQKVDCESMQERKAPCQNSEADINVNEQQKCGSETIEKGTVSSQDSETGDNITREQELDSETINKGILSCQNPEGDIKKMEPVCEANNNKGEIEYCENDKILNKPEHKQNASKTPMECENQDEQIGKPRENVNEVVPNHEINNKKTHITISKTLDKKHQRHVQSEHCSSSKKYDNKHKEKHKHRTLKRTSSDASSSDEGERYSRHDEKLGKRNTECLKYRREKVDKKLSKYDYNKNYHSKHERYHDHDRIYRKHDERKSNERNHRDLKYEKVRESDHKYRMEIRDIEHERKIDFRLGRSCIKDSAKEERRVVYVGGLPYGTTKDELWNRMRRFGPLEKVSVHLRVGERDNYGFVTFFETEDARQCVARGNSDLNEPGLNFCFGGRREYCGGSYVDFDSKTSCIGELSETYGNILSHENEDDFDTLLRQYQRDLGREGSPH